MLHDVSLVHDHLADSALRFPWKQALVCEGGRYTYRQLEEGANALARALLAEGLVCGERVMVFCNDGYEAIAAFWGILKTNTTAILISPCLDIGKLDAIVGERQPAAIVTTSALFPTIEPHARNSPFVRALIVGGADVEPTERQSPIGWRSAALERSGPPPSSSPTGPDLAAILRAATSFGAGLGLVEDDVVFDVLPLSRDDGLSPMIAAFMVGARLVLESDVPSPGAVLERLVREEVTGLHGPAAFLDELSEHENRYAFPLVRYVARTGDEGSASQLRPLQRLFPAARIHSLRGLRLLPAESAEPPPRPAVRPPSRVTVEPAAPGCFDAIYPVICEAFGTGGLTKEAWHRIIDYDFAHGEGAPGDRGWVLVDDGDVVGFLGAIYSQRGAERLCNVTAWAVKRSHRRAALQLLAPVFAMHDRTLLNLSATPFTLSVFKRMGFTELERCVVLVPPSLRAGVGERFRMVSDLPTIRRLLDAKDLRILEDHARYPVTHLVVAGEHAYIYVVAARTHFRRFRATYYHYRSSEELFRTLVGPIQRHLSAAHLTPFGVVDARLFRDAPPHGTFTYTLRQPRLYRPASSTKLEREDIDGLYSELVVLDPRRWTFNY